MIGILQRYVARELLKTFALTAIGLTLMFSLCGGVLNMIQAEVLTALEMARIMAFVLPIATTLTLPVAALFACAMVYGRLAADNEFDACKASGINLHRMLLPAFGLSMLTFAFTFSFTNYVIPSFIEKLDEMVRKDIPRILESALRTQGYIKHGSYVLYAGAADTSQHTKDAKTVSIRQAAFLEMEKDNLARCGTADEVRVDFQINATSNAPVVEASMFDVCALDVRRNQYYELREQPFDPFEITSRLEQQPKWLNLNDQLYYRQHPTELAQIQDQLARVRLLVRDAIFYRHVIEQLTGPTRLLELSDARRRYEVRAGEVDPPRVDPSVDDLRPRLGKVIIKESSAEGARRTYKADRCAIKVNRGFDGGELVQFILEGNVEFTDALDPGNVVKQRRTDLSDIALSPVFREAEAKIPSEDLLGEKLKPREQMPTLNLGKRVDDQRIKLRKDLIKNSLSIVGVTHSRLAFSTSVLVMLVLAAGLGIIFRGGQMLTAFVISFVPALLVVVMNIMGRQLTENTGTTGIGIALTWSGLVLVSVADLVILARYLKR